MDINQLQRIADSKNLTIKIQVREVLGLKIFRIIVAHVNNNSVRFGGKLKVGHYLLEMDFNWIHLES